MASVLRTLFAGLLGEGLGSQIIGLGAYLPALTDYGRRYRDTKIGPFKPFKGNYTTGHATTAWMISEFVFKTIEKLGIDNATVGIVGGAGSTGTAAAKVIGRDSSVGTVALFDVDRESKIQRMRQTADELDGLCDVIAYTDLNSLNTCDIIVVVTTAEGTIIQSHHLKPGAVVIDDSQPRNTSEALLEVRDDILIIDVLSRVPGLNANFDFDLVENDPEIAFTCLAETIILASHGWNDHFSMGILDVEKIDQIKEMGEAIGVEPAPFLQFNKPVTNLQWERIRKAKNNNTPTAEEPLKAVG
jgi:predicted amino acid dehydrogenase